MDDIKERLRKIKALAEDAQGTQEGISALLAYQRLLSKEGLSDDDISIAPERTNVVDVTVYTSGRIYGYLHLLANVVASHFRCLSFRSTNRYGLFEIILTGLSADVEIAKATFETALNVMKYNAKRLARYETISGRGGYNLYYVGFVQGLDMGFKEQEASGILAISITTPECVLATAVGSTEHKFTSGLENDFDPVGYFNGKRDGLSFLKHKKLEGANA